MAKLNNTCARIKAELATIAPKSQQAVLLLKSKSGLLEIITGRLNKRQENLEKLRSLNSSEGKKGMGKRNASMPDLNPNKPVFMTEYN